MEPRDTPAHDAPVPSPSAGGATVDAAPESRLAAPAGELPMVAIVGRANVGKSTLFNRLLRERRSLVEDRPGVTRDRVAAPAEIEGRHVLLVDTGGLDPSAEEGIPLQIGRQVEKVVRDAAVVLFVVSARDGLLPIDATIADLLRRAARPVVLVVNKADGPVQDSADAEFYTLGFDEVLTVSAEHRRGLRDLEISIEERLPKQASPARETGEVKIALIGRPNVGKSSLLNRLLGTEQAIVSDVPGTTRDATDSRIELGERTVVMIDTAGLRRAAKRADRLERGSAFQSMRAIERADVVLLLIDVIEGVTDQEAKIARLALDRGRPLMLVTNKWDAVDASVRRAEIEREVARKLRFVREPELAPVSAKTGKGVHRLLPRAIALFDASRRQVATSDVNRALAEAVEAVAPAMTGKRRARFFYATQTGDRPFTILVFMNDPKLLPRNYRRYLESFFRERFELRSAPLRLRFRARGAGDVRDEGIGEGRPRRR